MTYREALAWLFGTQLFGIKLGLENIQRLLGALRVPDPSQRIIHVAGTNGKGSVCAMIDSVCRAAGYRAGLFTSPHLVTFRERIQVNGEMIGEPDVARGLTSIREMSHTWDPHPTFFEIATALGLLHFRETACEIIVLETGMGGRLDATNAVTPIVSVLTPIDLDHQKWLGHTLAEIAAEKAGIIKPNTPVVSAAQLPEAKRVLRDRAAECGTTIEFVTETLGPRPALAGAHQLQNAALAVAACRGARISLSETAIKDGLATVNWPARFQQWNDRIVIDGAHNPAGARVLVQTWREVFGDARATVILAVLRDKDAAGIVEILAPIALEFLLPPAHTERAIPPEELLTIAVSTAPDVPAAVARSLQQAFEAPAPQSSHLLVTGSLHFAGEALAALRGTPAAFEECAQ